MNVRISGKILEINLKLNLFLGILFSELYIYIRIY